MTTLDILTLMAEYNHLRFHRTQGSYLDTRMIAERMQDLLQAVEAQGYKVIWSRYSQSYRAVPGGACQKAVRLCY